MVLPTISAPSVLARKMPTDAGRTIVLPWITTPAFGVAEKNDGGSNRRFPIKLETWMAPMKGSKK